MEVWATEILTTTITDGVRHISTNMGCCSVSNNGMDLSHTSMDIGDSEENIWKQFSGDCQEHSRCEGLGRNNPIRVFKKKLM